MGPKPDKQNYKKNNLDEIGCQQMSLEVLRNLIGFFNTKILIRFQLKLSVMEEFPPGSKSNCNIK